MQGSKFHNSRTSTFMWKLSSLLLGVFLSLSRPGFSQANYFNNFESGAGPEWSSQVTSVTPIGARRYLGQFGPGSVSLTLNNLPSHQNVRVSFDLFIIQTWDGNVGPDLWTFAVDGGPTLLNTTFAINPPWYNGKVQSYPGQYPSNFPASTGAAERNTLGYRHWLFNQPVIDAVYHLTFTFNHTETSLKLNFISGQMENIGDEGWGLDNVRVSLIPSIATPSNGASPRSNYTVLTGYGKPDGTVLLRDNSNFLNVVRVDSSGNWETIAYLGSGSHSLTAEDFDDSSLKSNPTLVTPNPGVMPAPHIFTDYSRLRKADVILSRSNTSVQLDLYGAQYSHAALYLGGDSNGTPLIAEAVPANESRGLGQVRTVPLEWSTVYTDGDFVDFFRSISTLSRSQKDTVVTWALGTTSRGLPYWNTVTDLGKLLSPNLWWNSTRHQPTNTARFNQAAAALYDTTRSTNKYICSTLVWQAYQQAGIDLSTPNNARISGMLMGLDPAYINRIRPFFVFPDTILLCGKLSQVH